MNIFIWLKAKKYSLFRSFIKDLISPKTISFIKEQTNAPDMNLSLKKLAIKGFNPLLILDIGAFLGEWSLCANKFYPNSKIIMIEPQDSQKSHLSKLAKNKDFEYEQALLSDSDNKEVSFNLVDIASGSSMFEPKRFNNKEVQKFKTKTLDSLMEKYEIKGPIMIKIDVQGAEYLVLKGATKCLKECEVVILELSIFQSYSGGLVVHEMIQFMNLIGFELYDIAGLHRANRTKSTNEFDGVFVKKNSQLWDQKYFLPSTKVMS